MKREKEGYRKLEVWQKAQDLAFKVYIATKGFPREEVYGLTSQMRRAAVSVIANLAEGYAHKSEAEKKRFYEIANCSLTELECYIDFVFEKLNYIDEGPYLNLVALRDEVGRMLNGLLKSVSAH